jgi:hypothetical protein
MRNKTIIGIAIATILTAYISALTMSNQAFAQHGSSLDVSDLLTAGAGGLLGQSASNSGHVGQIGGVGTPPVTTAINQYPFNTFNGQETHLGQVLGGISTTIHHILKGGLGCSGDC